MSGCKQCPAYAKCTATYRGSACDRKKLIAIIKEKDYWLPGVGTLAGQTLRLADHLIANGVTFATDTNVGSKWMPVAERLPEPFVSVLVQMPMEKPFPTVREGFITKDGIWHSAHYDREPDEVTHWMPLPEAPMEE